MGAVFPDRGGMQVSTPIDALGASFAVWVYISYTYLESDASQFFIYFVLDYCTKFAPRALLLNPSGL
jgi:hypothetical protein